MQILTHVWCGIRPSPSVRRCYCGDDTDDYNRDGPAICDMACSGESDSICGGHWAMSVYKMF